MRKFLRVLSLILLLIALALLLGSLFLLTNSLLANGIESLSYPMGRAWSNFDWDSLNRAESITQRYILPELWNPLAVCLLTQPLWLILVASTFCLAAFSWIFRLLRPRFR